MASLKAKLLYTIKSLKSDAVPRPPRPETTNVTEPDNSTRVTQENGEFIYQEEEKPKSESPKKENKQPKSNVPFFSSGNKKKKKGQEPGFPEHGKDQVVVNTQAGGDVMVITHSKDVHIGPVFNMGTPVGNQKEKETFNEDIQKTNLISLVMEAKIRPEHVYIDYISKNLGKNWHSFFRTLGFSKGRIETMEIDEARNGVSEARYKLLLDWARNDNDGTLGRLATKLWEEGEREVVKELAIIYKANRK